MVKTLHAFTLHLLTILLTSAISTTTPILNNISTGSASFYHQAIIPALHHLLLVLARARIDLKKRYNKLYDKVFYEVLLVLLQPNPVVLVVLWPGWWVIGLVCGVSWVFGGFSGAGVGPTGTGAMLGVGVPGKI